MPLYDYRCTACGRVIEVVHGIHDSGPASCEQCGGVMRKALSSPAIHFKGKGWAKKDAAAASAKKTTPSSGASNTSGTSTDTGSTPKAGDASTPEKTSNAAGSSSGAESKTAKTTAKNGD